MSGEIPKGIEKERLEEIRDTLLWKNLDEFKQVIARILYLESLLSADSDKDAETVRVFIAEAEEFLPAGVMRPGFFNRSDEAKAALDRLKVKARGEKPLAEHSLWKQADEKFKSFGIVKVSDTGEWRVIDYIFGNYTGDFRTPDEALQSLLKKGAE